VFNEISDEFGKTKVRRDRTKAHRDALWAKKPPSCARGGYLPIAVVPSHCAVFTAVQPPLDALCSLRGAVHSAVTVKKLQNFETFHCCSSAFSHLSGVFSLQ